MGGFTRDWWVESLRGERLVDPVVLIQGAQTWFYAREAAQSVLGTSEVVLAEEELNISPDICIQVTPPPRYDERTTWVVHYPNKKYAPKSASQKNRNHDRAVRTRTSK